MDPRVLFYVDPPYLLSTRHERYYQYEMSDDEHIALLDLLDTYPASVVLSGYSHPLYETRLSHWRRSEKVVSTEGGRLKTEVLWVKYSASALRQLALFGQEEWL